MNKSLKGEYISFYSRLAKRLGSHILLTIFISLSVIFGRAFSRTFVDYKIHFLIFLAICFVIGVFYHIKQIKTVVTEIIFDGDKLRIVGYEYNSKFEDSLDIEKTIIKIASESENKNKNGYYIQIMNNNKFYYLNWRYETLALVIDEYKLRTEKGVVNMHFYPQLISNKI